MQKNISILLLCTVASAFAADSGSLTLSDCISRARATSLKMTTAKLSERSAVVELDAARSDRYPTLSAKLNQTLYDSPFNDAAQDHYRLSAGLSGSMTLWDGGATGLTIESRQLDLQTSKYNTDMAALSLTESVMNAYVTLLASMEKRTQATDALALSDSVLQYNVNLLAAGSATRKDSILAASDVATDRVDSIFAAQTETSSRTTLRQLLEFPRGDSLKVDSSEMKYDSPAAMGELPDFETIMKDARASYPGLLADSVALLAAHKEETLAHKNNSVTVTLGADATTGFQAWESDRYANQMKVGYTHSVTLGITVPIIDKGQTTAKVLNAQIASEKAEVTRQETDKTLENEMEQLYLQAVSADASWNAAIIQRDAREEAFRVADEQYRAGSLGYTDYLERKNELESARRTLTQAKYSSILARDLLDLYRGKYK